MVQFSYLRLYLGIKTISCRLVMGMARMDMKDGLKSASFFKFLCYARKKTKTLLWFVLPDETCLKCLS